MWIDYEFMMFPFRIPLVTSKHYQYKLDLLGQYNKFIDTVLNIEWTK